MTESNRSRNVADEVARADQALQAAEALLSQAAVEDARAFSLDARAALDRWGYGPPTS